MIRLTLSRDLFITIFTSMALISYLVCFVPQIIENYQLQSTKGWSDSFILMYFFGCVSLLYYVFCLNLPGPYKILVPLEAFFMFVIIGQRLYYDKISSQTFFLISFFSISLFFVVIFPLSFHYPLLVGHINGWISFILFTLYSIPQTIKIFKEKSVQGFSLGYLNVFTFAVVCELLVSFTGVLPVQTIVTTLKSLLTALIFYIQFWLYAEKDKVIKK